MARYEAPSGHWWEIDVATDTMFDEKWGGPGAREMARTHSCLSQTERDGKIAALVAKRTSAGYAAVPGAEGFVPLPLPPSRVVRRLEADGEFVELTLDGVRVIHQHANTDRPSEWITNHDTARRDEIEARETFDRLTRIYQKRGFALVGEREPPPSPRVRPVPPAVARENAALEAECLAAPDAPEPWAVYADWLMHEGDVRGEIAALSASGHQSDAHLLVRDHGLYGGRSALVAAVEDRWRFGFLRGATIRIPRAHESERLVDLVREFLALPIARFVDDVQLGLADSASSENDWRPALDAIVASRQGKTLRSLRLDAWDRNDNELSWTPSGNFAGVWPDLPALETLVIKSGEGGELGELVLPALTKFVRISGGLGKDELAAIDGATWPRLAWLEVWFGDPTYGAEGDPGAIARTLAGERLPALRHLGLVNCAFSDALLPVLAASPILARVETLDLSKGVMAARAAELLVEHADAFAHLARIDVTDNLFELDELAAVRAALPNVRSEEQRERDDPDGEDDEDARWVAVGE